jgi:hypothetical protein
LQGALAQLVSGLKAFGFVGQVVVEDATSIDVVERCEVKVG